MREYGRIYTAFWTSPDVQSMSDDAKMLAAYLLTSQHTTLAGVFRLPDAYVSDDLGWTSARVSKGFGELLRKSWCNRCETTKWVWIRKFLRWNTPENPNQWKAARRLGEQIPSQCEFRSRFLDEIDQLSRGEKLPEPEPLPNGSATLSKQGSGSGSGSGSGKGEEKRASARPARKVPADFEPDQAFALAELPDLDVCAEIAKFRDFEFARPYSDWAGVWRNWVRRNKTDGRYAKKAAMRWQ